MTLNEQTPDPSSGDRCRITVFTPTGRDRRLIEALLSQHGLAARGCASAEQLLGAVAERLGPVLIAEEGLDPGQLERLSQLLDDQPPWSDLPVVLLRRGDPRGRSLDGLLRRPGVRWLRRPLDPASLVAVVQIARDAYERQQEVGRLLANQRDLNARLARRARQLQRLSVKLIEAEDRERRALADLLHDDVQQLLVGARLQLCAAAKTLGGGGGGALDRTAELLEEAQEKTRTLSHELFPPAMHRGDLEEVLRWLIRNLETSHGLRTDLDADDRLGQAEPSIVRFLYRAVREILCNAVTHAGVSEATVEARRRHDHLEIAVSDRGAGFDPARLENDEDAGLGLVGIRERLESLGGRLEIVSEPGQGSRFTLILPASEPHVPAAGDAAAPVGAAEAGKSATSMEPS